MVGIPELNIVISLSDGLISVHNLENIQDACRFSLENAKGALMFIFDLQKLKTLTDEFQYALRLCAVMKRKIMFFYWKRDEFHHMKSSDILLNDIPRTVGWCKETVYIGFKSEYFHTKIGGKMKELFPTGTEPFVECLSNGRFVLAKDENTYIFNEEGEPILTYPLNWSSSLIKIADDLIYLVGLLPNSTIEIKTIEPKLQIQTIQLQTRNCKFKHLTKCANRNGQIYACSTKDVFALVVVDYKQQISQLIAKGNFETALSLAMVYKDNQKQEDNKQIDYIKYLQAFDYFCKMQFTEAIKIYSELKIDPSVVIGLYPDLLPDEFRSKLEYPTALPELKGDNLDNAIAELAQYLIEVRHQLQKQGSKLQYSSIKDFSLDNKDASTTEVAHSTNIDKLEQIVDTTLLKCYLKTNDALVASLLRLPTNHCHLEEAEKVLKYYNKYNELIILYKCRNLHRRALELLQKINTQAKSSDKVNKLSNPHLRTKEYLQHLGKEHIDLIFEFAEWMLREYPDDGLKIFIEDISEAESLPRKQVLEYLRSINGDFVIPYLEHIIYVWKEADHNLHDTLVNEYREKIRVLLEEYKLNLGENQKPAKAGQEPGQLGILRTKLMEFLQKSDYYTAEKLAFFFLNDNLWEERALVLSKIGLHQEALTIYVYVLNDTDKAEEYCETVYNKDLPGNRDVFFLLLRLYLRHPIDIENVNQDSVDSINELNDNEAKPNLEIALRLLQNYATKMDPISVLNELPDSIPISSISVFLTNIIKSLTHRKHEVQVHRNLLLSEHLTVQRQKINLHRNKIVIDEYSLCHCCNKRIGKRYVQMCKLLSELTTNSISLSYTVPS